MYHTIQTHSYFPLSLVALGALLLMPRVSTAQNPSTTLSLLQERAAVLGEQFRDVLDRSPETQKELLESISDLRAIAEAMEAEKNLLLDAFPHGVPTKEIPSLVILVWELGYQAGIAAMLADEWERLLERPLGAPTGETGQ